MKRALGNWVTGEYFWDRKEELELFLEYIRKGANILLTAPRRIGKTSLMREAESRLGEEFLCLQVDFQKAQSAADAIVELTVAMSPHLPLWSKAATVFSGLWKRISGTVEAIKVHELSVQLRSEVSEKDWRDKGERLLEILAESERPVVLFLDEVPILVNRILQGGDYRVTDERRRATDEFMSWLRDNTIKHKGKLRIVVTGSIGLEPVLRYAGLNATLNTFVPFPLGAWQPDVARDFLCEVATESGLTLPPEVASGMVGRVGYCIPHYVQVYFENVYRACKMSSATEVSDSLAEYVYEHSMLSVQGHAELSHLEERLRMVLGPERSPLAMELLTELAVTGKLTPDSVTVISAGYSFGDKATEATVREILGILEHDYYIEPNSDGTYRPVSKLLMDWWKARFSFGYIKASERAR
ncbi:MAG: hypothetical protein ABSA85_02930 [Terracidiphilus sp.]